MVLMGIAGVHEGLTNVRMEVSRSRLEPAALCISRRDAEESCNRLAAAENIVSTFKNTVH